VPLMMIFLLTVGRIYNLAWSSPEVLQFSQPTRISSRFRDCRPVKISYFRLWSFWCVSQRNMSKQINATA